MSCERCNCSTCREYYRVPRFSNGVEMGVWALPARPNEALILDMTMEQISKVLDDPKVREELKAAIDRMETVGLSSRQEGQRTK